ncbi:MAG TPA: phosphatase PAP2 family protein, partial [Gammaproteobacteria bacterium]
PAYTLPGVVFGASLGLASQVAGRLAVVVLILVALVWFTVWLVGVLFRYLQPRAEFLLGRTLDWGQKYPLLQPLTASLLDPTHPEARGLAMLVVVLAAGSLLTTWLLSGWLAGLDRFLFESLSELRNPIADQVMVFITGLGDTALLFAVLLSGVAWLWLRGRRNAALHWLAMTTATALLTYLLKLVVAAQRPMPLYEGLSTYSFPSTHTTLSIAVYGYLAVLIARELTPARRWAPYIGAALLVIPIAFSRLYLGAHWLSDVLGGLALGLVTLALFGIAYRRHPAQPLGWRNLLLICTLTLIGTSVWRSDALPPDAYSEPREPRTFTLPQWWDTEWRALPAQRQDLNATARQTLNLQYAGDPAALQAVLAATGWHVPTGLSPTSALQWLAPQPDAELLPVLPQVHDGQHDALRLVRPASDGQRLYLLRLWPSHWQLREGAVPVWVGSVSELQVHQQLRLFTYLVNRGDSAEPLEGVQRDLGMAFAVALRRRDTDPGTLLLVRER